MGFLEDLQGALGWAKLEPTDFYAWLGPRSRRQWDELNRDWADLQKWKASQPSNASFPNDATFNPADINDPKLRKMLRGLHRPRNDPLRGPNEKDA